MRWARAVHEAQQAVQGHVPLHVQGASASAQHGQAEARDGAVHLLLHPRTLPTFLILRLDRRTRSHS